MTLENLDTALTCFEDECAEKKRDFYKEPFFVYIHTKSGQTLTAYLDQLVNSLADLGAPDNYESGHPLIHFSYQTSRYNLEVDEIEYITHAVVVPKDI